MHRRTASHGRSTTATTALALVATSALTVAPAAFAQNVPRPPCDNHEGRAADPEDKFTPTSRGDAAEQDCRLLGRVRRQGGPDRRPRTSRLGRPGAVRLRRPDSTAKTSQASWSSSSRPPARLRGYWINNGSSSRTARWRWRTLATSSEVQPDQREVAAEPVEPVKRTAVSDKVHPCRRVGPGRHQRARGLGPGLHGRGITVSNIDTGASTTTRPWPTSTAAYSPTARRERLQLSHRTPPARPSRHATTTATARTPWAPWSATTARQPDRCRSRRRLDRHERLRQLLGRRPALARAQWIVAPTKTDGSDPDPSKRPQRRQQLVGPHRRGPASTTGTPTPPRPGTPQASSAPGPPATPALAARRRRPPAPTPAPTRSARST